MKSRIKSKSSLLKLFLAIPVCMLLSSFTFASATQEKNAAKDVPLKGSLSNPLLRSSTVDFIVTVYDDCINIDYMDNLSNITIEITDDSGTLYYEDIVNPVNGKSLEIDISNWENGSYHISFTNSSGGCVYGDFDIGG